MKKTLSPHTKQFQKHLKTLKVDSFLVLHVPDLFYLAGYSSEGCWDSSAGIPRR